MLQAKVLNPKAKRILDELAALKLIQVKEEKNIFPLTDAQKKSIALSRKQIKKGLFKSNKEVISSLKQWVKSK